MHPFSMYYICNDHEFNSVKVMYIRSYMVSASIIIDQVNIIFTDNSLITVPSFYCM